MIDQSRERGTSQRLERSVRLELGRELGRELEAEARHTDTSVRTGFKATMTWEGQSQHAQAYHRVRNEDIFACLLCATLCLSFVIPDTTTPSAPHTLRWLSRSRLRSLIQFPFYPSFEQSSSSSRLGEGVPQPDGKLWTEINSVHV